MEYLAGGSLEAQIAARRARRRSRSTGSSEAAAALDAAHAAGIVHRDVKPANLLLDGRGHVHVADFGIASAAGLDSLTQTGTILGTAGYLSPEQAQGERATAASDRYALAVVAWELLTGRRPFAVSSPTAEALAHVNAPVPSVHGREPGAAGRLDPVFERALAKDPAARYATAAELVGELRRALHDDAGRHVARSTRRPTTRRRVAAVAAGARRWWIPALVVAAARGRRLGGGARLRRRGRAPLPARGRPHGHGPRANRARDRHRTGDDADLAGRPQQPSSGAALNNAGYAKMQAGDYAGALPLLQQAVQKLNGTGARSTRRTPTTTWRTRASRSASAPTSLALLDHAQSIEGHRTGDRPAPPRRAEAGEQLEAQAETRGVLLRRSTACSRRT